MTFAIDPPVLAATPRLFTRGTLSYTRKGVFTLFSWLMWNNFCFTLFENVQSFIGILYKNNGASYLIIGLTGSIGSALGMIICPIISTYSDRFRSKYGRRRPLLIAATPPLALITMAIPYMPDLGHYLMRYPALMAFWNHLGITGPIFCIGVGFIFFTIINLVITSLFIYYWWDVVPEELLGRFNGLSQIVGRIAMFLFQFFLYGYSEHHMKELCFGISLFFLVFYLLSTWRVKEGEYPPPEPIKGGNGFWSTAKTYFTDCYAHPQYLWIFIGLTIYQTGNLGNMYQMFYQWKDLGISLDTIGKFTALPTIFLFLGGYGLGSLVDRLKPIRLMAPCLLVWAGTYILSYYFVRDQWSFLICNSLIQLMVYLLTIMLGALAVEVYPREKLGQFCSAASLMQGASALVLNPLLGIFFDHIKNNRLGYLWSAGFQVMAALCFFRIYHNWKRLHPDQLLPGESPEPA